MKSIINRDNKALNLKINSKEEETNNLDDEEEYNLDMINHNIENIIESENNYNNFDENENSINNEQIHKNYNYNGKENNNEYLFEKVKVKLKEENIVKNEYDSLLNKENIDINKEEKNTEIYNLPLSINKIKNKNNYNDDEDITNNKNENENEKSIKNKEIIMEKLQESNDIEYKELNINNTKEEKQKTINIDENKNENNKSLDNEDNNKLNDMNKSHENENNLFISENKSLEIPEGVKFGVDESGNPVNIAQFLEDNIKGKNTNNNKLIGYIIQKDDKKNYLIDIKGNILLKNEDDYYLYKDGNEFIIIKDFDVQHPELRVYGHRKINYNNKTNIKEK